MPIPQAHSIILKEISKLQTLESGSEYFSHLVVNGVDKTQLEKFIQEGRTLKSPGKLIDQAKFSADLERLFDLGGAVAGGGALAKIFGTHKTPDYDVFFPDPISYVQAVLASRDNPRLDVCYSPGATPYDRFDLAVSKCSFTRDTVNVHPSCLEAIETGVSDLCPQSIVDINATLRRMLKYNGYFGMKFKQHQVLAACASFRANNELSIRVLKMCG